MAKQKKSPRKPTGEIRAGTLEVGGDEPAALSQLERFKLPEVKNDAEDLVMQKFVGVSRQDNAKGYLVRLASATHLPTDHGPDFEVVTYSGATGYFELLEIAPLSGRYEEADHAMLVGDLIDFVVAQVETKIRKYGVQQQFRPISLLLYVSHYGFSPGTLETSCIMDTLQGVPNQVFDEIYLELFAHDGNPLVVRLWPFRGGHFAKSHLTDHRRRQMIRADPARVRIMSDKSQGHQIDVTIRQCLPKGTNLSKIKVGPLSDEEARRFGLSTTLKVRK